MTAFVPFIDSLLLKLHDEISSVAESCLDLKKRVKQIEQNVEKNETRIGKQGDSISAHETTLDNHTEQINDLINLKNDLNQIHSNIDSLNRFKELQAQRDELNSQQPTEINNDTIGKLQVIFYKIYLSKVMNRF